MARGINKVIIIGNLGADPETRAMPSGTTVANLRVAMRERGAAEGGATLAERSRLDEAFEFIRALRQRASGTPGAV